MPGKSGCVKFLTNSMSEQPQIKETGLSLWWMSESQKQIQIHYYVWYQYTKANIWLQSQMMIPILTNSMQMILLNLYSFMLSCHCCQCLYIGCSLSIAVFSNNGTSVPRFDTWKGLKYKNDIDLCWHKIDREGKLTFVVRPKRWLKWWK